MNTSLTIDANGKILGRVASEAALFLCGKQNPSYMPHLAPACKVIIINAALIRVTGTKQQTKIYKHFSGYPSGLKKISFEIQMQRDPQKIILHAIRSMLPKNKLRAIMMRNLTVRAQK